MLILHYLTRGVTYGGVHWGRIHRLERGLSPLCLGALSATRDSDVCRYFQSAEWQNGVAPGEPPRYPLHVVEGGVVGFARQFSRLLQAVKPNVVHVHGLWHKDCGTAAWLAHRAGIPYMVSTFGLAVEGASGLPKVLERAWLQGLFAPMFTHAAAVCVAYDEELTRLRQIGVRTETVLCLHSYVDPERVVPRTSWTREGRIAGVIDPSDASGTEELRMALKALMIGERGRRMTLVCRGSTHDAQRLQQELTKDNPFAYESVMGDADPGLDALFRRATCVCALSSSGAINTLLARALDVATPIVCPRNTLHGLLDNANAALFCTPTARGLFESCSQMIHMTPEQRQLMGLAGRQLIDQHCSGHATAQILFEKYKGVGCRV